MPSEGRAGAPARPLLFLSGVDALVFLVAVGLNLEPLLRFDGLIRSLLIWSAVVLVAASAAGFAGGILLGRPSASRTVVTVSAVLNGILVSGLASYYATEVQLFGVFGSVFVLLAVPGFVGAWVAWQSLAPS